MWKMLTGDPGCDGFDQSWQECKKAPLPSPFPSVWLYNLETDPTELHNVYDQFPEIVSVFLKKLAVYDANSYPTYYPAPDPEADPALHNGYWGPWKTKPNDWPRLVEENDVY